LNEIQKNETILVKEYLRHCVFLKNHQEGGNIQPQQNWCYEENQIHLPPSYIPKARKEVPVVGHTSS
jgi:hypothetical protein